MTTGQASRLETSSHLSQHGTRKVIIHVPKALNNRYIYLTVPPTLWMKTCPYLYQTTSHNNAEVCQKVKVKVTSIWYNIRTQSGSGVGQELADWKHAQLKVSNIFDWQVQSMLKRVFLIWLSPIWPSRETRPPEIPIQAERSLNKELIELKCGTYSGLTASSN